MPPTRVDTLLDAIIDAATQTGLPKYALAERAGLHKNTLKLFPTAAWTPSLETIRRMERAFLPQPSTATEHKNVQGNSILAHA